MAWSSAANSDFGCSPVTQQVLFSSIEREPNRVRPNKGRRSSSVGGSRSSWSRVRCRRAVWCSSPARAPVYNTGPKQDTLRMAKRGQALFTAISASALICKVQGIPALTEASSNAVLDTYSIVSGRNFVYNESLPYGEYGIANRHHSLVGCTTHVQQEQ